MTNADDHQTLAASIRAGDRRALAKGITLIESTKGQDREGAERLLVELLPASGGALRLGLSGAPGVGKSTFIEAFGNYLTEQGKSVAVLAVDPSSTRSGGSILGDKTRMEKLSRNPMAYIRPSPSGGSLGGVARRTRESMLLVEAAGFDVVIVETVGVGQSETSVAEMVDLFALLLAPGGGDDLQGIKRGIMELADLVIVNKADGDLERAARLAVADFSLALQLMRPKYADMMAQVISVSALENRGMDEVWTTVQAFDRALREGGHLASLRKGQAQSWLWSEIREGLLEALRRTPGSEKALEQAELAVARGELLPTVAARKLLAGLLPEG